MTTSRAGQEPAEVEALAPIDLDDLLVKTSRTFALAIPLLPEPNQTEVAVSYLLYRIADTFEDAATWEPGRKRAALAATAALLDEFHAERAACLAREWVEEPPIDHAGYTELLSLTPQVLQQFEALDPAAREIIRRHLHVTIEGMDGFVQRGEEHGELRLADLEDLRHYCFIVAGNVGEMLTELFLRTNQPLQTRAEYLRERSRAFGEALQLVNILKDCRFDATEGRTYLPPGVTFDEVLEVARDDVKAAEEYTTALFEAGAPVGLQAFHSVIILLARATLNLLSSEGAGAKMTRPQVYELLNRIQDCLQRGGNPVAEL